MALSKVPSSGMSSTLQPSTIQLPSGGSLTIKDSSGVDTYLSISSTGRVTTPYQPSFRVYAASGGSTNLTAEVAVIFDSKHHDTTNSFNTSTYTFTAPVAGTYFFSFALFNNGSNAQRVGLRVNGGQVFAQGGVNSIYTDYGYSCSVFLQANDNVKVVSAYTGGVYYRASNHCEFSGFLVG